MGKNATTEKKKYHPLHNGLYYNYFIQANFAGYIFCVVSDASFSYFHSLSFNTVALKCSKLCKTEANTAIEEQKNWHNEHEVEQIDETSMTLLSCMPSPWMRLFDNRFLHGNACTLNRKTTIPELQE